MASRFALPHNLVSLLVKEIQDFVIVFIGVHINFFETVDHENAWLTDRLNFASSVKKAAPFWHNGDGEDISSTVTMPACRKFAGVKTCHSPTTFGDYITTCHLPLHRPYHKLTYDYHPHMFGREGSDPPSILLICSCLSLPYLL